MDKLYEEFRKSLGIDEFLNHSCEPNAGLKDAVTLIAIRDIKAHEEILFDYSTCICGDWIMKCSCGSVSCRGIIGDFKYLPYEIQRKYIDMVIVPSWILKQNYIDMV